MCNKCGDCLAVCEVGAISIIDQGIKIDRATCTNCGKCKEVCLEGALKVFGYEATIEEAVDEVCRDEVYYRNSGGGVTASGGEPNAQPRFTAELLRRCQAKGIHTAIETCGYAELVHLERVLRNTDLVLYDLKIINRSDHVRWAGRSNEKILSNLESMVSKGVPVVVRVPLVPTITDTDENLQGIAQYVAGLKKPTKVELLPYHHLGSGKYEMLDRRYKLDGQKSQEPEEQNRCKRIFESFGVECDIEK